MPQDSGTEQHDIFVVRGGRDEEGRYWDTISTIVQAWRRANPDSPMTYRQVWEWIVRENNLRTITGESCVFGTHQFPNIIPGQRLKLPEGNELGDFPVVRENCPDEVTAAPPAADRGIPEPTEEPRPAPDARDPRWSFPQHADPRRWAEIVRAGYLSGVLRADPADWAAQNQVQRGDAAGTWVGPNPFQLDDTPIVPLPIPFPFSVALAVVNSGVRIAGTTTEPVMAGTGPGRQPIANILEGWRVDENGRVVRVNPGDNANQPDWVENTDGLVRPRYTLSTTDPRSNWDMMTEARISAALESPNGMAGWMCIQGLQRQIGTLYGEWQGNAAQRTPQNAQRLLDHIAAAAKTDFAQDSGLAHDYYARLQAAIVAEAQAAGIPAASLRTYDMDNPDSIPALADFPSGPVHPLQVLSYDEISRQPGFEDNNLTREEYERQFPPGTNFDYIYNEYAVSRQSRFTRDAAMGRGTTPTREEIQPLTEQAVQRLLINDAAVTEFRRQIGRDPAFGLIIGESLNDMIHHPETYGFANRDEAIAYAERLVGRDVVQSQFLQDTDIPRGESTGRVRDPQVIAAAFAANADNAETREFMDRVTRYPQDPDAPENRPGVGAQAILYQIAVQQPEPGATYGPAFTAITAAAGMSPQGQEAVYQDLYRIALYTDRSGRGSRYGTEDLVGTRTIALEARSPDQTFQSVGPDGRPMPADAVAAAGPLVRTGVDLRDIQERERAGDRAGATLLAVRRIMENPGQQAVALEAMSMYDRRTATNLMVASMATNPQAFEGVLDRLRDGTIDGPWRNLNRGQRRLLATALETTAERYRDIYDRFQRGRITAEEMPAELERAGLELDTYLDIIDSQNMPPGERTLFQDERGRMVMPDSMRELRERARDLAAYRRAVAEGRIPEGAVVFVEDGRVEVLRGSDARALRRRAENGGYQGQYQGALQQQDSIVALMQGISADSEANAAMTGTVQSAMGGDFADRVVDAVDVAGPDQVTGVGPSTTVRRDASAIVADRESGDAGRIMAATDNVAANGTAESRGEIAEIPATQGAPTRDILNVLLSFLFPRTRSGGTPPGETPLPPIDPGHCPGICPG